MKQNVYTKDIILILATSFCFMACTMLVTPLITGFSKTLGATAALMGMVGGLMNICSLICRPIVGNLADKMSKYKVACIGAGMMIIACIGYMVSASPLMVIAFRLVNGIGFACCSVCMATWMSNLLPRDKIGSGMGIYGTMNALAMAIAPSIGLSVYDRFGYRASFIAALAFAVGTLVLAQFVSDKGLPEKAAVSGGKKSIQLVDKKVIPLALIVMLFAIPYCATQSFLVSYAADRNLNVTVSLFFPLYAAAILVLRLTLKNLFDKLPFGIFFCAGCVCAFGAIACLTVMNSNAVMILAGIFMAGGYGIMCSVCQSTAILLAGKEKRGLANSTYFIGLDLGLSLGPILGGFLYGNVDIKWFYPCLMLTIPACIAVFVVWTLSARKQAA